MRVLSVASEMYPLIKTGGLADVAGALPAALAGQGVEMRTLLPGYAPVLAALENAEPVLDFGQRFGAPARLLAGRAAGLDLFVLDIPTFYVRPGGPYNDAAGRDWPDNALRFAALAQAGCAVGLGAVAAFVPDIVHAHDWQAGLAPAYLHYAGGRRPGTVMTVHNLAFQGWAEASLLAALGLPQSAFNIDGIEFFGGIGFLKAGLRLADRITTVSPGYAAEIQTMEGGMALDGLLRARAEVLTGIVNGIDISVWDPAKDPLLPAQFDAETLHCRALNKAALQSRMALEADPGALLFGMVSRLTGQKGADLLLAVLPVLRRHGARLAVLGSGEPALETALQAAAAANPGQVGIVLGYDEALAHLVQGGCDAVLVPSRFEPCGLTQLCALRYGAVPVVARVGGLADTVIDANPAALAAGVATGVQFAPVTEAGLAGAITRTSGLWRDQAAWQTLQANGMAADVSWRVPAARYAALYRELAATARGPGAAPPAIAAH